MAWPYLLGLELLTNAGSDTFILTDNHTREVELSISDSYKRKFNEMNLNAELSASFLSGIVIVSASAQYLTDTRHSNASLQTSPHFNIITVHEKLNFMNANLKQCLGWTFLKRRYH